MHKIELENISIEIEKKNIKNVHLRVYSPDGKVKITAPKRMDLESIRRFAISKLQWIKSKQIKFINQKKELPKEFISNENHYFFGNKYLLKIIERTSKPVVILNHTQIELYVKPDSSPETKKKIMDSWYRRELNKIVPDLIIKWETIIGVTSNEFRIKKMRTRWGTCNIKAKRIWLNLELAKMPIESLEYIIVHELVHLLERNHNYKFKKHMDEFMPEWKKFKNNLNKSPFRLL